MFMELDLLQLAIVGLSDYHTLSTELTDIDTHSFGICKLSDDSKLGRMATNPTEHSL